MSIEKTNAIILKVLPYHESSYIVYLFTERHGLVHGIAKGIRRAKQSQSYLERGFCIETSLYIKPHRDLHTLSAVQVIDFFPSVRTDIIKGTIRDAAFELILHVITESDIHPELYQLFCKFMQYMDSASSQDCYPFALWLFYIRFLQYCGFGFNMNTCMHCNACIASDATLNISPGGLVCHLCDNRNRNAYHIPYAVISYLKQGTPKQHELRTMLSSAEFSRITRILVDYCRYHFDFHKEYKALDFLLMLTREV